MSNSKLCIQKEHRELLVRSEATKNFPKILNLLIQNDKLSFAQLESDYVDSETKSLLLYSIKNIIQDASDEWRGTIEVVDLENERVKCTLCGQPNRYMCYIVNDYNGTKINVGTECVKYFKGLNYSAIKRSKQKLINDSTLSRRKAEINEVFPYLDNQILDARKRIIDNRYVLPTEIESNANTIINEIQSTYNDFMKGSKTNECFKQIRDNFMGLSNLFSEIDEFNSIADNDEFSCDIITKKWLVSQKKEHILDKIKMNRGKIDCETILHICNKEFINKFLERLRTIIDTNQLLLIKHENNKMFFRFTYHLSYGKAKKRLHIKLT